MEPTPTPAPRYGAWVYRKLAGLAVPTTTLDRMDPDDLNALLHGTQTLCPACRQLIPCDPPDAFSLQIGIGETERAHLRCLYTPTGLPVPVWPEDADAGQWAWTLANLRAVPAYLGFSMRVVAVRVARVSAYNQAVIRCILADRYWTEGRLGSGLMGGHEWFPTQAAAIAEAEALAALGR